MKVPKGLGFLFAIRLCFYEGVAVLAFLQEKKNLKLNAIQSALIRVQH